MGLHNKIFSGFAKTENVTVIVQFCYAVWTAYGTSRYERALGYSNPHKTGHTLGYYKSTNGAQLVEQLDSKGEVEYVFNENFVATYENGDSGAPCGFSPRVANLKIRCTSSFSTCAPHANIASNCTQQQLDNGGCICSFEHVTSCASDISMLVNCGSPRTLKYLWWNMTDVLCWAFLLLLVWFTIKVLGDTSR